MSVQEKFVDASGYADYDGFMEEANVLLPGWLSRHLIQVRTLDDQATGYQIECAKAREAYFAKMAKSCPQSLEQLDDDADVKVVLELQDKIDKIAQEKIAVTNQIELLLRWFMKRVENLKGLATDTYNSTNNNSDM
eukprot:Platyproteum_vivax@DN1054_c0_g1_i3.p1